MPTFTWDMTIDHLTQWQHKDFLQMFVNALLEKIRLCPGIPPNGGFAAEAQVPAPGRNIYYYYVTADLPDGETPLSPAGIATLPDGTPWTRGLGFLAYVPPTTYGFNFSFTDYHDTYGVKLSWTPVAHATGYNVYWSGQPVNYTSSFPKRLAAHLPPTMHAWEHNGADTPGLAADFFLLSPAGTSSQPAMAAPTAVHGDIKSYNVQIGDNVQGLGGWGYVGQMQTIIETLLPFFCDPTNGESSEAGDSTTSINRGFNDGTVRPHSFLESLILSKLWRRKRPREVITDVIGKDKSIWWKNGYRCAVNPGDDLYLSGRSGFALPNADYMAHFKGAPGWLTPGAGVTRLTYICDGTDWHYAHNADKSPDYTAQPDILDSENAVGSGNELTPGIMQFGDMIGPWSFNQIRRVLNAMQWTFDRPQYVYDYAGGGVGGAGAALVSGYLNNLTIICDPNDSIVDSYEYEPRSEAALDNDTYNQFRVKVGFGAATSLPAAYAAAVANLHAPTPADKSAVTGLILGSGHSAFIGAYQYVLEESHVGGYTVSLQNISFKLALYPICLKYPSSTDFLLARYNTAYQSLGDDSFGDDDSWGLPWYSTITPPVSPTDPIPTPPFLYALWETVEHSADDDALGAIMGTRVFNSAFASEPQQSIGVADPIVHPNYNVQYGTQIFPPASVTKWSGLTYVGPFNSD